MMSEGGRWYIVRSVRKGTGLSCRMTSLLSFDLFCLSRSLSVYISRRLSSSPLRHHSCCHHSLAHPRQCFSFDLSLLVPDLVCTLIRWTDPSAPLLHGTVVRVGRGHCDRDRETRINKAAA